MSNMGYARYRNTLDDLWDCYEHMEESVESEEARARLQLINLCAKIAAEYHDEDMR
jgi:hypothetical protein